MYARAISSVEIIRPWWKSCTRTSREDRWSRNEGRKFLKKMGQSSTKCLTVVINEKLREWILNHPPVQELWILTSRELWITVHHCAKKKRTSIICVANLHSLLWNITSKAHKIRTTLTQAESSSVHRGTVAFTMRVKPGLLESSSGGSANSSSNPVSIHPRTKSNYRKGKNPSRRTEFGLWFLDDIREEDITRDSHLQECLLRHHDGRRSEEARTKLIGKRIHVWGLVALPLPQKLQICKLGDIRAIRRP